MRIKPFLSAEVVILVVLLLMLDTFAQVFFKIGVTHLGEFSGAKVADIVQYSCQLITSPFVIGGVVALIFAFFTWLTLISKVDLSFAHPMTSLVYATIPLCSTWFLHEALNWKQAIGIVLIVAGVFIVSEDNASTLN